MRKLTMEDYARLIAPGPEPTSWRSDNLDALLAKAFDEGFAEVVEVAKFYSDKKTVLVRVFVLQHLAGVSYAWLIANHGDCRQGHLLSWPREPLKLNG